MQKPKVTAFQNFRECWIGKKKQCFIAAVGLGKKKPFFENPKLRRKEDETKDKEISFGVHSGTDRVVPQK